MRVGPADKTGKSVVTYWPGGTRPAVCAGSCRLRWNPRETGLMPAMLSSLVRPAPSQRGRGAQPRAGGLLVWALLPFPGHRPALRQHPLQVRC